MMKNIYNTLTIKERYNIIADNFENVESDLYSLQYWKNNINIISDASFKEMLKINNYKEKIFTNAIKYNIDENTKKLYMNYLEKENWYQFVAKCFGEFYSNEYIPENDLNKMFSAFFNYSYIIINNYLKDYNILFNKDSFLNNILRQLEDDIFIIANKAIILDINLQSQKNNLQGDTPGQRYNYYINSLSKIKNVYSFFEKYPVLLRKIANVFLNFNNNIIELLDNLKSDYNALCHFFEKDLGNLNNIKFSAGDSHNSGKSVSILNFENVTLIYKPKNLEINLAFENLTKKINEIAKNNILKSPKTLVKEEYSYEEYITYNICQNTKDLEKYYFNFGVLSSVLYYLNANDIHFENIICHQNKPVVVDLETLLQQPWSSRKQPNSVRNILNKSFHRISRTSLFPNEEVSFGKDTNFGIDMSALTGKFKENAIQGSRIVNKNTDFIKYEPALLDFQGAKNMPYDDKKKNYYKEFYNDLLNGFSKGSEILKVLAQNFNENFSEFTNKKLRVIVRNTSQYDNIRNHLNHPDLLENMLDQEKLLENLWGLNVENKVIVKSEYEQLLNGDIPVFFIDSDSNDLYDTLGNKIKEAYEHSPFEYFERYIKNNLTTKDIRAQKQLIYLHSPNFYEDKTNELKHRKTPKSKYKFDFLEESKLIGENIISSAINKDDGYDWIIPVNVIEDNWSTKIMGHNIYDGKAGIFLYFASLKSFYKNRNFEHIYDALCQDIVEIENIDYKNLGLTNENLGYFYALSIVNDYGTNNLKFRKHIKSILVLLEKKDDFSDVNLDYINGIFPLLNALYRYFKKFNDRRYLNVALKIWEDIQDEILKRNWKKSFGHGILGCYYTFDLFKDYMSKNIYEKVMPYLLKKINELESFQKVTWCNGQLGEYIIGITSQSLKCNIDELGLKDESLCHGTMGIIDYLLNINDIERAKRNLNSIIAESKDYGSYKTYDLELWKDVSLYTGLAGIGYQLLRLQYPNEVKSILMI
ncbi:type 2 lanthipeptide synthetase LanM [Staphylococcus felis]|uniref:type 2 lanthipeptide synthetase LanM n=1 Tax=Staphylococcus felis TaxID=46127 RepID=UPI00247FE903|nr:type 2 lanthipeptide synthetase LanM [Staphylococcus felis]